MDSTASPATSQPDSPPPDLAGLLDGKAPAADCFWPWNPPGIRADRGATGQGKAVLFQLLARGRWNRDGSLEEFLTVYPCTARLAEELQLDPGSVRRTLRALKAPARRTGHVYIRESHTATGHPIWQVCFPYPASPKNRPHYRAALAAMKAAGGMRPPMVQAPPAPAPPEKTPRPAPAPRPAPVRGPEWRPFTACDSRPCGGCSQLSGCPAQRAQAARDLADLAEQAAEQAEQARQQAEQARQQAEQAEQQAEQARTVADLRAELAATMDAAGARQPRRAGALARIGAIAGPMEPLSLVYRRIVEAGLCKPPDKR